MDLHERLSASREANLAEPGRDSFSEVKNRIHFAVISGLGPQLFNTDMDARAMRERVIDDIRLPFARPRHGDLVTETEFVRLKRHILNLLRRPDHASPLPRLSPLGVLAE